MNEREFFYAMGYVKVSPSRTKVLRSLGNSFKMPSEIAKDTDLRITQVSNSLADLKKEKLVVCLNEHVTKGRLYQCTDLGKEIAKNLK